MNTAVTSKEAILVCCRQLVSTQGLSALNMRAVADACHVALGSLYYYFPSKNDLVLAAIESVWEDIFRWQDSDMKDLSFPDYLEHCFKQLQSGIERYPNFFTLHAISFSTQKRPQAQDSMRRYLAQIREKLIAALRADPQIKQQVFSLELTEHDFIDFVLSNMVYSLVQKKDSCPVLLKLIRHTLYQA